MKLGRRALAVILTALVVLAPARTTGAGPTSSSEGRVAVCVCLCPSDDYPRDERAHLLAGLRRAFDLDSLLLERPGPRDSIDFAGRILNRYLLAGLDVVPDCGICERYITAVRQDALLPERREIPCRQAVRVTLRWSGIIPPMPPGGRRTPRIPGVTEDDWRGLSVFWRRRMLGAGAPPDSELFRDDIMFPERAATRERLEEIRGWMTGMTLLQGLHRADGALPDSLELVFDSLGRNH